MPLRWNSTLKPSGVSLPYTQDQFIRTEKYRVWRKANRCKIHSRRRRHLSDSHLKISSDSSMFINQGQGLGYPPKIILDSDYDQELPLHILILQDYCRTCLTEKVRCSCQPTFIWSGELIDTTLLAPQTWTITKTGKKYRTTPFHQIGQTKTISGWVKPMTKLRPNQH